MSSKGCFFKQEKDDAVWWYDKFDTTGEMLFSFDRKKLYNLFRDYPWKLSVTEWLTFNRENEFWENFFEVRNAEYREAHAEDIEKHLKAVEGYRTRRDGRVKSRMDEENHGNTKLPFGLCEREGIEVGEEWTPKDAWEALEGKGYSASEEYKELSKTEKKAKTQLSDEHFPSAMLGKAYRKNTMEFAKYINEHCQDDDAVEFLSCAMGKGGKMTKNITCLRKKGVGASVTTWTDPDTRIPTDVQIAIPNFAGIKDESVKAEKVRDFAHEWTHFIDECARDEDTYGHFTDSFSSVQDAISEDDGSIIEDIKKMFGEFNDKFDAMKQDEKKKQDRAVLDMASRDYGHGEVPVWCREDGSIDYITAYRMRVPTKTMKEYEKKERKIRKDLWIDESGKRYAIMNGVSSLQGLYDSINGGKLQASGVTRLGHPLKYFKGNPKNKATEALASYIELKVTSPELVELFRKDKPKIAKALDDDIIEITKRMRNGRD